MARGAHTIQVLGPLGQAGVNATGTATAAPVGRSSRDRREAGQALPELRPRGIGELLDTAFDALRERFVTCMLLTVPMWFVVQVFKRALITQEALASPEAGEFVALVSQGVIAAGVRAVAMALVTLVVYEYMQGRRIGPWQALRACRPQALALLGLTVITAVGFFFATACGAICLFVPTVALYWLWAVAPAVLVLERASPLDALARSARLARRGFPRWAGVMIVQAGVPMPLLAGVGALDDPTLRELVQSQLGLPGPLFTVLDLSLSSLVLGLGTALTAVVLTVYYLDQRVRVEGLDLDMGLERLRRQRLESGGSEGAA